MNGKKEFENTAYRKMFEDLQEIFYVSTSYQELLIVESLTKTRDELMQKVKQFRPTQSPVVDFSADFKGDYREIIEKVRVLNSLNEQVAEHTKRNSGEEQRRTRSILRSYNSDLDVLKINGRFKDVPKLKLMSGDAEVIASIVEFITSICVILGTSTVHRSVNKRKRDGQTFSDTLVRIDQVMDQVRGIVY